MTESVPLRRRPFPAAVRYALELPADSEDADVLVELTILRAEAELAERERPIIVAAIALAEHSAEGPWKATTHEAAVWDGRYLELINTLVEKVKEAQGR